MTNNSEKYSASHLGEVLFIWVFGSWFMVHSSLPLSVAMNFRTMNDELGSVFRATENSYMQRQVCSSLERLGDPAAQMGVAPRKIGQ